VLTAGGRARLGLRWFDRLPADQALAVLAGACAVSGPPAAEMTGRRPYEQPARLQAVLSGGELPGLDTAAAGRVRALILGG
jgi:allantoicase